MDNIDSISIRNLIFPFKLEQEQIVIPRRLTSEVLAAIQSVRFIAQHIKDSDRDNEVSEFNQKRNFTLSRTVSNSKKNPLSMNLDEIHQFLFLSGKIFLP